MADELYQEFFLCLCEIKDDRLIEADKEKYLDVFCVGIINNIWSKRNNVKRYEKGKTSPLFDAANISLIDCSDERFEIEETKYDPEAEYKAEKLHETIDQYRQSGDINDQFRARVFYHSKFTFKNIRQFSKAASIPYLVCVRAFKEFKQKLKDEYK